MLARDVVTIFPLPTAQSRRKELNQRSASAASVPVHGGRGSSIVSKTSTSKEGVVC